MFDLAPLPVPLQVLSVLSSGPPMGLNGTVSLAANLKGAEAKIFRNGGTWGLSQGYLAALGPAAVYRLQVRLHGPVLQTISLRVYESELVRR